MGRVSRRDPGQRAELPGLGCESWGRAGRPPALWRVWSVRSARPCPGASPGRLQCLLWGRRHVLTSPGLQAPKATESRAGGERCPALRLTSTGPSLSLSAQLGVEGAARTEPLRRCPHSLHRQAAPPRAPGTLPGTEGMVGPKAVGPGWKGPLPLDQPPALSSPPPQQPAGEQEPRPQPGRLARMVGTEALNPASWHLPAPRAPFSPQRPAACRAAWGAGPLAAVAASHQAWGQRVLRARPDLRAPRASGMGLALASEWGREGAQTGRSMSCEIKLDRR